MPTYYDTLELIPTSDDPVGFRLKRSSEAPKEEPDAMITLRRDFGRASQVISTIFEDDKVQRVRFFESLYAKAYIGFIGSNIDLDAARDNLKELQEDLATYGLKIRSKRLEEYTKTALIWIFIPCFIFGLIFYFLNYRGIF